MGYKPPLQIGELEEDPRAKTASFQVSGGSCPPGQRPVHCGLHSSRQEYSVSDKSWSQWSALTVKKSASREIFSTQVLAGLRTDVFGDLPDFCLYGSVQAQTIAAPSALSSRDQAAGIQGK